MDVAGIQSYRKVLQADQSDQLIVDHLTYVRHLLGRMVGDLPAGVDVENLEAAGVLGLVEAARKFDVQRGVEFTTFAYPRIRGAIVDELRRNCPLPQQMLQRWRMIRDAYACLPAPIAPESLAEATGLTLAEVTDCLRAIRLTNPDTWHDALGRDRDVDARTPPPSARLESHEEQRLLADAIERLPEQERRVVTLYHLEDLRLREIGEVLNLSESRVCRVLAAAELRLKETLRHHTFGIGSKPLHLQRGGKDQAGVAC